MQNMLGVLISVVSRLSGGCFRFVLALVYKFWDLYFIVNRLELNSVGYL